MHKLNLFRRALPSADGAALLIRQFVLNLIAKVIRRGGARHEPISVQADQVESVVTLVDSDEVLPFRELVLVVLFDVFELLVNMHQVRRLRLSIVLLELFVVLAVVSENLLVQLVMELSLHLWVSWFFERAQANCAFALDGVVLLGQVLSDFFVQIEEHAAVVFVLALLLRNRVKFFVHLLYNFFKLLLFEALFDDELESWRLEWIPVFECDLQV